MPSLTDAQKSCPHVFVGKFDGVHCTRCGLHLTAQQYHELLHPPEDELTDEKLKEKAIKILAGADIPVQTVDIQADALPDGAAVLADEIYGSVKVPGVIAGKNIQVVMPDAAQDAADTAPNKEPAGGEKPAESVAEAPQAKHKRTRKKKEETTGE